MMRSHASYSAPGYDIGLGIIISREADRTLYFHTGGTGGFESIMQVIPEQKIIRVGLVNNSSFEPIVAVASRDHAPPAADEAASLTPEEIDAFIGVYQLSADARFTLFRREGKLYAGLTGQPFLPYQALKGDRFYFAPAQAELRFHRKDGRITSLTLHQYGQQIPARRIQDSPDTNAIKLPRAP